MSRAVAPAPEHPNVTLRGAAGDQTVVLAFPYDVRLVEAVRRIPYRRFDWDTREWSAPATGRSAIFVRHILDRYPTLTAAPDVAEWLTAAERYWVGRVRTTRYDGRGWWTLDTLAGPVPEPLRAGAVEHEGRLLVPFGVEAAAALREQEGADLDQPARRCLVLAERGEAPPPARLGLLRGVEGPRLMLEDLWDQDAGLAFDRIPGASKARTLVLDPWVVAGLDAFLGLHGVPVGAEAAPVLADLRAEADAAADAVRRSRATSAEPLPEVAARLGGELRPFQWAGVRYLLDARRSFLADEQGLGKTVEALAALEADDAFPATVVCPASLKLNWAREAKRWLPHRSVAVVEGRVAVLPRAEITVLNYEVVAAHAGNLLRRRPRALVIDESHYVKNPHAKRTKAVRRLAAALPDEALRLALTGTPVLNRPDELVAQLRVLGRMEEFGSGVSFARRFRELDSEKRLHWHLRRHCFVRRLKSEVLPQLPAKRQVVVPVELSNRREYELAEEDVVAWLREQPLDLSELEHKIAATLRAERLAQLSTLQRLAARGKLGAALGWIEDFMAHGEPLVVFARHVEVQEAVVARFPGALNLLGRDSVRAREETVRRFQDGEGDGLIVCATRVAAQGITLTRASNVAFLELEWTPALHDQAEDRCHRIGQHDAVVAWYLLAAETIDETMAALIQRKRATISAVTEGRRPGSDGLVAAVARELRTGRPARHLRPVA